MKVPKSSLRTFAGLRRIVAMLRSADGCPWDRVQTHESLKPYLLEEAMETLSALNNGDPQRLREELGDLLLEILLHVQIAEEAGEFHIGDVLYEITDKLIRRHPHVFGDGVAETPEAVVEQWEVLKQRERGQQSALAGVAQTLPALAYSQAIQRRAGRAGFAYESAEQAWEAFEEEVDELRAAGTPEQKRAELGDALFTLANLARYYEVDAEDALRTTSRKFARIFQEMEGLVRHRGIDLGETELQGKLALWEEAKAQAGQTL